MLFSIIIPVYNAEKWLARCFGSIRSQSFSDYEVILINDGSSDNSETICKEYEASDSRVRYYYQENKGVSAARNKGLSKANGTWIVFLDSDDCYYESFLTTFASLIDNNSTTDTFCCGYEYIAGTKTREYRLHNEKEIVIVDRTDVMYLYEAIMLQSVCNKAYKKEIIDSNNLEMNEDISLGEDLLFNLDYLDYCNNEIVVLNRSLYKYYCDTPDTLNKKYRPDIKETFEVIIDRMGEHFMKWGLDSEQMSKYYNAAYSMLISTMRNTFRLANKASYKDKIAYNNEIIKSDRFKTVVKHAKGTVHPLYKAAFRFNDYRLIRALDKVRDEYIKRFKQHIS